MFVLVLVVFQYMCMLNCTELIRLDIVMSRNTGLSKKMEGI